MGTLGAGSDYASFIHFLGITSMDLAYTYDRVSRVFHITPFPALLVRSQGRSSPAQIWFIH